MFIFGSHAVKNPPVTYSYYTAAADGANLGHAMKQYTLPPWVNDALLRQTGRYAPYLELAIACERPDGADVAALSRAVGLDSEQVNNLHVEAMIWAHQVSE